MASGVRPIDRLRNNRGYARQRDFDDARRTDCPVQTTPMIAGQRDYVIGVSQQALKLKRIDISYVVEPFAVSAARKAWASSLRSKTWGAILRCEKASPSLARKNALVA